MATSAASEGHQAFQERKHFANLDGVRFICITAVLWHHAGFKDYGSLRLLERGFLGVDFFFVLSGFLITTLLLREEARKGSFSFRGFYWRRFLRIIPVYFFVVTLSTLYFGVIKGQSEALQRAPFYYLFLSNFLTSHTPLLGPTWSLSVEEQYYVVWPLLMALVPRPWLVPVVSLGVTANVVGAAGGFDWFVDTPFTQGFFVLKLPNATYAPILLGSLTAILLHRPRSYGLLSKALAHRLTPIPLVLGLSLLCQFGPVDLRGLPNLAIHCLMSALLISLVTNERNCFGPLLNWSPLVRIGQVSYGLYLYHLVGLHVATVGQKAVFGATNPWANLFLMYAVSMVMAELSHRTLEAYFRSFRNRPPFTIAPSTRVAPLDSKNVPPS